MVYEFCDILIKIVLIYFFISFVHALETKPVLDSTGFWQFLKIIKPQN